MQRDADRREIYALVTGGPLAGAHGPLPLEHITRRRFTRPRPGYRLPPGDPALADDLAARAGQFHDLDDFYTFYGYPPEVARLVGADAAAGGRREGSLRRVRVPVERGGGRVGPRPGPAARRRLKEAVDPGRVDPIGDPVYFTNFAVDENWAVTAESGPVWIDPTSYRFKAWLSFLPGPADARP